MGPEVVLLAATFALTQRPEVIDALDAQYGVGPKVEQYVKRQTPEQLWQTMALVGPVAQVVATRRLVLQFRF